MTDDATSPPQGRKRRGKWTGKKQRQAGQEPAWNMYAQTGPEVVVTATGSLAIVAACWERAHPMALPALIYWGLGSTCYLMLVAMIEGGGGGIGFWWWAYQGVRVLAWAVFAAILVRAWRARAVLARAVRERMIGMLREGTA